MVRDLRLVRVCVAGPRERRTKVLWEHVRWVKWCLVYISFLILSCRGGECPNPKVDIEAEGNTSQQASPVPAKIAIDGDGMMHFSAEDRCPVCAMVIMEHPEFASGIRLQDGRSFYFCGTGCMMKAWLNPGDVLGVGQDALELPVVQDYFEGKCVDARKVIWVAGSDVMGPMGPAFVPLLNEKHLATFKERHGGKKEFQFEALNAELWEELMALKKRMGAGK